MKLKICCKHGKKDKKCLRKGDKKMFNLPRKYTKKKCIKGPVRGFTMRASCAPYKGCKKKKNKSKKRKTIKIKPLLKFYRKKH